MSARNDKSPAPVAEDRRWLRSAAEAIGIDKSKVDCRLLRRSRACHVAEVQGLANAAVFLRFTTHAMRSCACVIGYVFRSLHFPQSRIRIMSCDLKRLSQRKHRTNAGFMSNSNLGFLIFMVTF